MPSLVGSEMCIRDRITDDSKLAKLLTSTHNSSCLLICHDLFNSKITYQVPGTRYWQSILYATTLIYCSTFPETKSMSSICDDDLSTSCSTRECLPTTRLYPLNPRSSTDDKGNNKTQSTSQLFLGVNRIVSASGRLKPSHSHLTKSTTTSYSNDPPCFLVFK